MLAAVINKQAILIAQVFSVLFNSKSTLNFVYLNKAFTKKNTINYFFTNLGVVKFNSGIFFRFGLVKMHASRFIDFINQRVVSFLIRLFP